MDRYEYKLKVEQLEHLLQEKDYETAAEIADTINWRKVRSAATLCMVGEIYDRSKRMTGRLWGGMSYTALLWLR